MARRRMVITAILFCICFFLMPSRVCAAYTTDAKEKIAPARECTLTLSYRYDGTPFADVPVRLYHVADVSADAWYTLTTPFRTSGLIVNGIRSNGEWTVIRSTLEAHILANRIAETRSAVTDQTGHVLFTALKPGLYLAIAERSVQNGWSCSFETALVALPGLDADGHWQYQVTAAAKPSATLTPGPGPGPSPDPEEEVQFKVLKLWKGDEGTAERPRSVEVEIFRDGVSYQTVTLSEENYWSYSWTAKDDGAEWMVVERNIPDGYVVTLERRAETFVLTNTLQDVPPDEDPEDPPEDPKEDPKEDPPGSPNEDPSDDEEFRKEETEEDPYSGPPRTGDTPHVLVYFALMYVSGTILILMGIFGKRKRV